MSQRHQHSIPTVVFSVFFGVALTVSTVIGQSSSAEPEAERNGSGRIVMGPASIRAFNPEETAVKVEATEVDLSQVFYDLGGDAITWYQHAITLSNPYFEGRGPDTDGLGRAADYLEFHLKRLGLEPAFPEDGADAPMHWTSYRQPFDFSMPGRPVRVEDATLRINGDELTAVEDYVVLGISGSDRAVAPLTFVGYGITDGPDGYDSFGDADLSDRIAVLFRYEPLEEDGTSQWSRRRFSQHSSISNKINTVVSRGAAGVILVNPPGAADAGAELEPLESSVRFGRAVNIPVVQMTLKAADELVQLADPAGRDLTTLRRLADNLDVQTVDFRDDVTVEVDVTIERGHVRVENVGAVLRGRGELADEWIVIGGHYDHVGFGYTGIRRGNRGYLHPGADDNASGTAAVLVMAERLIQQYQESENEDLRSIMFVLFTVEEAGLHGSRYFVENPPMPLEDLTFMMNFDMVGRLRDNRLSLSGVGTAEEFSEIVPPHVEASGLTVAVSPGGLGPSDHASFYRAGIPVLFPFTGLHDAYHTPGDKGYTLNPYGAVRAMDLMEPIVMDIVRLPQRLTYDADQRTQRGRWTPEAMAAAERAQSEENGDSADEADPEPAVVDDGDDPRMAPVRLGIMPSYDDSIAHGVLVDAVFQNSAAAAGGIQQGDILISWNGEDMADAGVLMNNLRQHRPGDEVTIELLRGERKVEVKVTLTAP